VNEASRWNVGGLVKVHKEMSQLLGIKKQPFGLLQGG